MPRVERRSSEQPTRRREPVTQAEPRTTSLADGADRYGGPLRRRNDQAAASFDPDESLRDEVCQHLAHHPDIDASDVEVLVEGGEVTLQGTVEDRDMLRLAEGVAESVSGVSLASTTGCDSHAVEHVGGLVTLEA